MKKVININFHGQIIAIEETAYEVLKQYIDSLKDYFSREDGGDEIVNDIECRIAELFGNRLKHGIACITDEDVESIITSIGKPHDFDTGYEDYPKEEQESSVRMDYPQEGKFDESGEQKTRHLNRNSNDKIVAGVCSGLAHYFKTDPIWIRIIFVLFFGFLFWVYIILWIVLKELPLKSNVTKRLYRNPNNRIIGGVCGGLATYFNIDAWIPRVIFLLPLIVNFTGGGFSLNRFLEDAHFGINLNRSISMVYIILWIIIPKAKTVKQKLEMMGEEEYIQSIRDKVNDNMPVNKNRAYTAQKEDRVVIVDEKAEEVAIDEISPKPPVDESRDNATSNSSSSQPSQSGCANVLVLLLKIALFTVIGITVLALFFTLVALLFTGAHMKPVMSLFIGSGTETRLLVISLCLLVAVPVISIVIWIIRRILRAKSRPAIGIVATVFWMAGLVTSGLLVTKVSERFRVKNIYTTPVILNPVTSNKMYIEMIPYGKSYSEFKLGYGSRYNIDWLPMITANEDSILLKSIDIKVESSKSPDFKVYTTLSSNGYDANSIEQFSYPITQNDSILYLPEFLITPIKQGFMQQNITVVIEVPVGKTVVISDELSDYTK